MASCSIRIQDCIMIVQLNSLSILLESCLVLFLPKKSIALGLQLVNCRGHRSDVRVRQTQMVVGMRKLKTRRNKAARLNIECHPRHPRHQRVLTMRDAYGVGGSGGRFSTLESRERHAANLPVGFELTYCCEQKHGGYQIGKRTMQLNRTQHFPPRTR